MKKFLSIFFSIITLSFPSIASESQVKLSPKLTNFIKKLESQKTELQGGAIAILYKGEVVYKTTFGMRKGNVGAITDKTLFPLESTSKAVSAMAIALMVDQGSLNFDETFTLPYLKDTISYNICYILKKIKYFL
ncbi:MAG TPA: beta-lactamase family protein [Rickettsia endosymbiont of Pyrocoelia pectoralis]|nr:beta-lactamase family protein [Rickettsia endosymbiont of Pyrocoelia pectoralis]